MLDIMPVKDDGMTSCFDVQLEAFGIWKKVGYELMFLDNWKFNFEEDGVGYGIWKRGKLASRLYFDYKLQTVSLFEKFHGIKVNFRNVTTEELANIVKENLNVSKNPILISFDTFYLPWLEKFYQKIYSEHCIMVIGESKLGYYINDTRPFLLEPIHGEELSKEVISLGFLNNVFDFEIKKVEFSFQEVKEELLSIDLNMFAQMHNFANYLEWNPIEIGELEDFDGGSGILFRAFRNIIRSRMHLKKSLKYINLYYINVSSTIEAFDYVIKKWVIIKNLLLNAYISNDYDNINHKMALLIDEVADFEEKIATDFISSIRSV